MNKIKHVQTDKPLHEFTHKNHWKRHFRPDRFRWEVCAERCLEDEWYIADNIRFSRYLFLEQLNYQSSRSLLLYRLCLNSLHYMLVFQQHNSDLIQSGFVVCACYWRFLTGSLRMSEKCGTLKGFGFKKAGPIDDGKIWKITLREKKKMLLTSNFPFFFSQYFPFYERKQLVC